MRYKFLNSSAQKGIEPLFVDFESTTVSNSITSPDFTTSVISNEGNISSVRAYEGTQSYYTNTMTNPDLDLQLQLSSLPDIEQAKQIKTSFWFYLLTTDIFGSLFRIIGSPSTFNFYFRADRGGTFASGCTVGSEAQQKVNNNSGWYTNWYNTWNKFELIIDFNAGGTVISVFANDSLVASFSFGSVVIPSNLGIDMWLGSIGDGSGNDNGSESYVDNVTLSYNKG